MDTDRQDRKFGAKLEAERRRRRELMRKQNKTLTDYEAECKYSHNEEDRRKGNELALKYCDQLNDEIDESLNRSLAICAQTSKVGSDTCKELQHQTEQIHNIHKNMHETNECLKDSERSIQTIQSWKKGIVNWFRKPRQKQEYQGMDTETKPKKKAGKESKSKDKTRDKNKKRAKHECKEVEEEHETKWNKIGTSKARKTQQREKMKEIDNYLDELMEMTEAMGQEMESQNQMIEQVQDEMEDLDLKFVHKNRKMRDILHQ